MTAQKPDITAGVLLIGDELLSGRTKDKNFAYIAGLLTELGINVCEARVVADVEDDIVSAVRALSEKYVYVFSSGGIGPTHDDITADAMAKAFSAPLQLNQEVADAMEANLKARGLELTPARRRMARFPQGSTLIKNSVAGPPGFQIENVFVMAGVPAIFQGMLEDVIPRLETGAKMISRTVECPVGEGDIGDGLGDIQKAHPSVSIGSYPFWTATGFGTNLVLRATDEAALDAAEAEVSALVEKMSGR